MQKLTCCARCAWCVLCALVVPHQLISSEVSKSRVAAIPPPPLPRQSASHQYIARCRVAVGQHFSPKTPWHADPDPVLKHPMSLLLRRLYQHGRTCRMSIIQGINPYSTSAAADVGTGPDTRRRTDERQAHAASVGMPDTQQPTLHVVHEGAHPAGAHKQPESDLIRHLKGIINVWGFAFLIYMHTYVHMHTVWRRTNDSGRLYGGTWMHGIINSTSRGGIIINSMGSACT